MVLIITLVGEYPAGSVGCAETSGELKEGTRNRWFILFTNTMIDWGFVIGAFVPCKSSSSLLLVHICKIAKLTSCLNLDVVAAATHDGRLTTIWRTSLGIGVVFPLILFVLRLRLKEPEEFSRESMRHKTPYLLVLRYYGLRLLAVSIVWFLYDVCIDLGPMTSLFEFL